MRLSLRDYTLADLEQLLANIQAAIENLENAPPGLSVQDSAEPEQQPEPAQPQPGTQGQPSTPKDAGTPSSTVAASEDDNGPEPNTPAENRAPPPAISGHDAPASRPAIKYMHPASRHLSWSGEGEPPEWVTVYLQRGGSWTAMENAAASFTRSWR
jgi:hypothetical protein